MLLCYGYSHTQFYMNLLFVLTIAEAQMPVPMDGKGARAPNTGDR